MGLVTTGSDTVPVPSIVEQGANARFEPSAPEFAIAGKRQVCVEPGKVIAAIEKHTKRLAVCTSLSIRRAPPCVTLERF